MPVIVDTSVWSLGLRRRRKDLSSAERAMVLHFEKMLADGEVVVPGVVRQEVLTGIRDEQLLDEVSNRLQDFGDAPLEIKDYVRAAKFANVCRARGIASNVPDMLICSLSSAHGWPVLTTDHDFVRYAQCVRIQLYYLS